MCSSDLSYKHVPYNIWDILIPNKIVYLKSKFHWVYLAIMGAGREVGGDGDQSRVKSRTDDIS